MKAYISFKTVAFWLPLSIVTFFFNFLHAQKFEETNEIMSIIREDTAKGLVTGEGDTLYLAGNGDYRKQTRRIEAASKSCVIAMAGDRKSDFDELFDYLRLPQAAFRLDPLFDAGWFLAPAPIPPATLAAQTNEDSNALDPR